MEPRRLRTCSAAETEAAGADLGGRLRGGDVVLVAGELGTGKTTLIRGACRALGVREAVTSPTFTIGQRYSGEQVAVAHLDLYRLSGMEGEEPGLIDDYLAPDSVVFVEWPGRAESLLASDDPRLSRVVARVEMRHAGGGQRAIEIEPVGT